MKKSLLWNILFSAVAITILIPTNSFCQCVNVGSLPSQDYDCDGIINRYDLDDDNDGILDAAECINNTTFALTATALSGASPITSFPDTFINVNGISGLNIVLTPSGNFTTPAATAPNITGGTFSFAVSGQGGNGVNSTWTIDFIGPIKPTSVQINSNNNLYARNGAGSIANEQFETYITRLGTGAYTATANTTCPATSTPDPVTIIADSVHSQVTAPIPGSGAITTCGYITSFMDNNGISQVQTIYSMPVNNGVGPSLAGSQFQPFLMNITVCNSDVDGDGIPNYFDLDSDADNCPDASEGGGTFPAMGLSPSSMAGGSTGVNRNLGTLPVDANGVPVAASGGQSIGSSENAAATDPSDCAILPLAISEIILEAKVTAYKTLLQWQTQSEKNTTHFNMERSFDGKIFGIIGDKINAAGNSITQKKYSTSDYTNLNTNTFYRVATYNADGKMEYSNVVTVRPYLVTPETTISPNPAQKNFNIRFNQEGNYTIAIYDSRGMLVFNKKEKAKTSNLNLMIQIGNLINGLYFVHIVNDETKEKTTIKLALQ